MMSAVRSGIEVVDISSGDDLNHTVEHSSDEEVVRGPWLRYHQEENRASRPPATYRNTDLRLRPAEMVLKPCFKEIHTFFS